MLNNDSVLRIELLEEFQTCLSSQMAVRLLVFTARLLIFKSWEKEMGIGQVKMTKSSLFLLRLRFFLE